MPLTYPTKLFASTLKTLRDLLDRVPGPLQKYFVVGLVVSLLMLTVGLFFLPPPTRIWAWLVAIGMVGWILFLGRPGRSSPSFKKTSACVELRDRASLYLKAVDLLTNARTVADTTWGRTPPGPPPAERERYISAKNAAIARGVVYHELFSETPEQVEEAARLIRLHELHCSYKVRVHRGLPDDMSLVDFLVVDNTDVLLSHVDATAPDPKARFVFIHSEPVADIFWSFFHECWDRAAPDRSTEV